MTRPEMKKHFLLSLNESGNDSFSDEEIASFLTQAEVSIYNQSYGNYKKKQVEQQVPPNSYQENQYNEDLMDAFQVRLLSMSFDITGVTQSPNIFFISGNLIDEISHFSKITVANTGTLNNGIYTIISTSYDNVNNTTRILVFENINNLTVSGQVKLLIPDVDTGYMFLPKDIEHLTQFGAKVASGKIVPIIYTRFNDFNILENNEFTSSVYNDILVEYNIKYITGNKKNSGGVILFPNSITVDRTNPIEYSLVLDYLTFPVPVKVDDLAPNSLVISQFPLNIHPSIVKEAVSLYLLTVSDTAFQVEQVKVNSGTI